LNSHKQIQIRLTLLHRATLEFDQIVTERGQESAPEYPLYEVSEMLKQSLKHPEREIRSTSQQILQLINDKHGFSVVENIATSLHPQILQAIKAKIPELDKVILYLQKTKQAVQTAVYGVSGASQWPATLKKWMNKAQTVP